MIKFKNILLEEFKELSFCQKIHFILYLNLQFPGHFYSPYKQILMINLVQPVFVNMFYTVSFKSPSSKVSLLSGTARHPVEGGIAEDAFIVYR